MKHFRIEWLDGAATQGFMEVDDVGNFVRLTDLDGNTVNPPYPDPSYRTLDTAPATPPAWALTNGEKITAKEALKTEVEAALKSGLITDADLTTWQAEAAAAVP